VAPSDGEVGCKRVDVAFSRARSGGMHVDIEGPPHLAPSVDNLLAALDCKAGM